MQQALMDWKNLRQAKCQNLQEYTQEFRKRALILGIPIDTQENLLKFIGGLHSYLCHTIIVFNPLDVFVTSECIHLCISCIVTRCLFQDVSIM